MVIILPIPTYFYNKRIYNMQVLQEHNIFSLVAHVGMESSSENSMYVIRDDVIFYIFNFQWSLFLCFPNQLQKYIHTFVFHYANRPTQCNPTD